MGSSIAYDHLGCTKARKYDFVEHSLGMFWIGSSTWQCFYPFGYIVHGHQDVFIVLRLGEWPHEINSPHIKEFHLEIIHERHWISRVNVPLFLTSMASPDKFLCIFIHCSSEKATLLDLGICLECFIMSSISWGMTSLHNLDSLSHRDTSPQQSINANSE